MENILEVSGLCKKYSNFSLEEVSFFLPEGCIGGLIGVNGAGKTTTLRSILSLIRKDAGKVSFFGMDMQTNEKKIKERLGIVFEDGCFYEELTMAEMKSIIAPAYSSWSEPDYKNYMDRFSLNPRQKISTLSKGMKMKFALVLALSHKADLLIMDEPASGLDPLIRSELLNILKDYMREGGRGVLLSTHITSDLDKIADVLIMMDHGKIVLQEEKDRLFDEYRIVRGNTRALHAGNRSLFLSLEETPFGFRGLTNQTEEVQKSIPEIVLEHASIEDIMLGTLKGGK